MIWQIAFGYLLGRSIEIIIGIWLKTIEEKPKRKEMLSFEEWKKKELEEQKNRKGPIGFKQNEIRA